MIWKASSLHDMTWKERNRWHACMESGIAEMKSGSRWMQAHGLHKAVSLFETWLLLPAGGCRRHSVCVCVLMHVQGCAAVIEIMISWTGVISMQKEQVFCTAQLSKTSGTLGSLFKYLNPTAIWWVKITCELNLSFNYSPDKLCTLTVLLYDALPHGSIATASAGLLEDSQKQCLCIWTFRFSFVVSFPP